LKNKILITGINGFLGSHLAKHLKSNFEVIGLEYSLENLHRISDENFKVYSTNESPLEVVFKENDFYAIVHVATVYRRQDEPIFDLLNTNINLPVQLLELSGKYNAKLFLNTDSFFNDANHSYSYLSDYTLSKKHSLEWLKLLASNSTCKLANMKIFHMYGENDAPGKFIPFLIKNIKSNQPTLDLTPGEQTRDFIYVEDVATAFEKVLCSFNLLEQYQEFEVGTGKSYTIKELAILIKEITNSTTVLNFGAIEYRAGEIMDSNANNLKLSELSWKPKFSIKEGLSNLVID
jgi:nucleoside-diphosphate-sugar epimerase